VESLEEQSPRRRTQEGAGIPTKSAKRQRASDHEDGRRQIVSIALEEEDEVHQGTGRRNGRMAAGSSVWNVVEPLSLGAAFDMPAVFDPYWNLPPEHTQKNIGNFLKGT